MIVPWADAAEGVKAAMVVATIIVETINSEFFMRLLHMMFPG
jgi:hypothetical protein